MIGLAGFQPPGSFRGWARQDSNLGPRDYESPALTAELQARFRDANIQYSPPNVQHSMSEDGLLGKKFGLRIAGRGFGMEA